MTARLLARFPFLARLFTTRKTTSRPSTSRSHGADLAAPADETQQPDDQRRVKRIIMACLAFLAFLVANHNNIEDIITDIMSRSYSRVERMEVPRLECCGFGAAVTV